MLKIYKSKLIGIKHCFSTRWGGISKKPYDDLNLAYHVGDNKDDVDKNHQILAEFMGYDPKKLIYMDQIHSNKVVVVDKKTKTPPSCDALITDKKDTPLMVMSADCAGVLFYDDKKKVIAVSHVGRAGAFGDIISNVIKVFKDRFFSDPKDIKVLVGPNIKACCYEVSQKEIAMAKELGYHFACKDTHLDIDSIILYQLKKNNIPKENIEFLDICTRCNSDMFFSYRKEKTTGRNCGVIIL
jgi:YfiH family protein